MNSDAPLAIINAYPLSLLQLTAYVCFQVNHGITMFMSYNRTEISKLILAETQKPTKV